MPAGDDGRHCAKLPGNLSAMKFSVRDLAWVYRQRSRAKSPVMHLKALANIQVPDRFLMPLLCGRRQWRRPADLTILLVHNYATPPIMERSLRYLGINDFVVVRPDIKPWWNAMKIPAVVDYLRTRCATEYVLYVDSNDAVLSGDPDGFIPLLKEHDCDLLFSATHHKRGYEFMPQKKQWADQRCKEAGCEDFYLNSGVYIGRADFILEVFQAAAAYVTYEEQSPGERWRDLCSGAPKALSEFPKGVASDQMILRYLEPRFYPRLKLDYRHRLAVRSGRTRHPVRRF